MQAIFQRLMALLLILVLLPIFGYIALIIAISSPGPIIFRQTRVGKNQQLFTIYKFRTMYHQDWPIGDIPQGDYRVVPRIKWLRSSHLDELPQLWNVVRGEMAFLGPRPEALKLVQRYLQTFPRRYARRFEVLPGITGIAQVFLDRPKHSEIFRFIALEEIYQQRKSWRLDLWIVYRTVIKVLKILSY